MLLFNSLLRYNLNAGHDPFALNWCRLPLAGTALLGVEPDVGPLGAPSAGRLVVRMPIKCPSPLLFNLVFPSNLPMESIIS